MLFDLMIILIERHLDVRRGLLNFQSIQFREVSPLKLRDRCDVLKIIINTNRF